MMDMVRAMFPNLGTMGIWLALYTILALRYLVLAGPAFLIWYGWKKRAWLYRKIQKQFPRPRDYYREIGYSFLTFLIFTAIGLLVFATPLRSFTFLYETPGQYGWGYFFLSIILMLVIHDAYFYWTHRLMHHPRLFRYFHLVHHRSTNPSPWAAFAFHPLEAVVEASILFVIVFTIPAHPRAILIFLLLMTAYNVYGHLGWELYPNGWSRNWIGKWINTSVNHNMHHKYFKGNYGLYFLWWDRWMGTLHSAYDETFEEVTSRERPEKASQELKTA